MARLFLSFLLTCFVTHTSYSETIHLGIGDWCPYVCDSSKESGKLGYVTDIAVRVFERAGYEVRVDSLPFARNLQQTLDGRQHATVAMYREDAPNFIFPDVELGISKNYVYRRFVDNWNYTGIGSLENRRVGIIKGYAFVDEDFETYTDFNADSVYVAHGTRPLQDLIRSTLEGRIDGFPDDFQVVTYNLKVMKLKGLLVPAGSMGGSNKVYIGFSPVRPESKKMARILTLGLNDLRRSGGLEEILHKYGLKDWNITNGE